LSDVTSYTGSQGVRQMRFWAIFVRRGVIRSQTWRHTESDVASYTGSQNVWQMWFWAIFVRRDVIHWQSRCL